MAVTALSGPALQAANIDSGLDLPYLTPGLQANVANIDNSNVAYKIRGITSASGFGDGNVAVYVDGIYRELQFGLNATFFDMDRVEILKGAQGTLYGKNTAAGVVNIITRNPDLEQDGGYVTLRGGSYLQSGTGDRGAESAQAAFNMPIIPGKLAVRVAADFDQSDGYGTDAAGHDLNNHSSPALRGKVLFAPNDDWKILLSADYSDFHSNNQTYKISEAEPGALSTAIGLGAGYIKFADALPVLTGTGPPGPSFGPGTAQAIALMSKSLVPGTSFYDGFGTVGSARAELKGGSITVDGNLGNDVNLRSITGYRSLSRWSLNDLDGTPYHEFETTTRDLSSFASQEVDIFGKLGSLLDWQTGVYYSYFDDHAGGEPGIGDNILTSLLNYITLYDNFEVTNSIGVFGHTVWHATDKLDVTAGLRWSQDTDDIQPRDRAMSLNFSNITSCLDNLYGGTIANQCVGPQLSLRNSGVSYDFSLDYRFTDELMAYAKTSKGYKSGNFNSNGAYTTYQPEYVNDYELGEKSEWWERRFLLNFDVYYIRYNNIQRTVVVSLPDGTTGDATNNAARAHIVGSELETEFKPDKNWEFGLNYAYTYPKYDDFLSGAQNLTGSAWEVAKHTIDLHGIYGVDVNGDDRLSARLDWVWQSDIVFAAYTNLFYNDPILRQNSYGIVNGRLSYDFTRSKNTVAFFGRNLLGRQYNEGGTGLRSVGTSFITPGEPRFIGIELDHRFGGG